MTNGSFWHWYNREAAPKLEMREISFRKIFNYLDMFDHPITIVETGCVRIPGNWSDGQSTLLFDEYVKCRHTDSMVYTIDLDPNATAICKSMVSDKVSIYTGDSVLVLREIGKRLEQTSRTIDLLYLDSYDLDWDNPTPSAVHHLKELTSIIGLINPKTLVVVDDCALVFRGLADALNNYILFSPPVIGGKGQYVAEYAAQVRASVAFSHYQVGWTDFVT